MCNPHIKISFSLEFLLKSQRQFLICESIFSMFTCSYSQSVCYIYNVSLYLQKLRSACANPPKRKAVVNSEDEKENNSDRDFDSDDSSKDPPFNSTLVRAQASACLWMLLLYLCYLISLILLSRSPLMRARVRMTLMVTLWNPSS